MIHKTAKILFAPHLVQSLSDRSTKQLLNPLNQTKFMAIIS